MWGGRGGLPPCDPGGGGQPPDLGSKYGDCRPPTKRRPPQPPVAPAGWIPEGHVHSWSPKAPFEWWTKKWDNVLGPKRPIPTYSDGCEGCLKYKDEPAKEDIARRKEIAKKKEEEVKRKQEEEGPEKKVNEQHLEEEEVV